MNWTKEKKLNKEEYQTYYVVSAVKFYEMFGRLQR